MRLNACLVHDFTHVLFLCVAAPLGVSGTELKGMPRFFDMFASLKSSSVGGLVEMRRMYVSFGYMYALDFSKCIEGKTWKDILKQATCTPLGVQVQCYSASGGGYSRKSVESWSVKGRVQLSDGLPIVGVPAATSDVMRVRRIKGAAAHTFSLHVFYDCVASFVRACVRACAHADVCIALPFVHGIWQISRSSHV